MGESRVNNGWAFALASFPFWGTALAIAVIEFSGSFDAVFGRDAEYLKLLQDRSNVVGLWIYWMAGTFLLGLIDARQLQRNGVALPGWALALLLLLPPAYFFARNWAVATAAGGNQPSSGWLLVIWIIAVGFNVIFAGVISADQLLKISRNCAVLIAWVLLVAALWSIGERLFTRLWKRP